MNTTVERTFVVVGAAGGIGKEIVRQLQPKARVIAIVENQAQADEIAGLVWRSLPCNLIESSSVVATLQALQPLIAERLDGVVFCAAMQPVGPVELIARADLERLFAINVFGTLQLVQGLIPALRRSAGRIVLFSSMAGRVSAPMLGAYSASKFALEGLSDSLRRELSSFGITVSLVEPGGVRTPMSAANSELIERGLARLSGDERQLYEPMFKGFLAMTTSALRHATDPAKVARVAVEAVSASRRPKARYVVGMDAKLVVTLGKWLPVRWIDALLMKAVLPGGERSCPPQAKPSNLGGK